MQSVRRILLPRLEAGWDEGIDVKDRPVIENILSLARDFARFRQSSAAVPPSNPGEKSLLGRYDAHKKSKNSMDMSDHDGDDDEDMNPVNDDDDDDPDSIDYLISPSADHHCYYINLLFPRAVAITANRLGQLCGVSVTQIIPNMVDFGTDLQHNRTYINLRVMKHTHPMVYSTRLVVIEQLGAAPAMHMSSGLPLGDGVSVRRTPEGTVVNTYGSPRNTKRARRDND